MKSAEKLSTDTIITFRRFSSRGYFTVRVRSAGFVLASFACGVSSLSRSIERAFSGSRLA